VNVSRLWSPVTRWGEFRRRQLAALEESNRIAAQVTDTEPAGRDADSATGATASAPTGGDPDHPPPDAVASSREQAAVYGVVGRPLNRHSPFYIGFFGATGALLAVGLWQLVGRLTTTLTLLVVSLFLALALSPIVDSLVARGLRRAGSVAIVFSGLVAVFAVILAVVIPPVVVEGAELAQQAPGYVEELLDARWVRELDRSYDVIDKVREEMEARMTDEQFLQGVLGGILGAGRAVLNGAFQVFTVLVLTLYFLSSLPRVKQGAYAVVPSSRRARVQSLSEEIMRRVGSYATGQVAIATLNAVLSYVMMTIVGIPYAAVLAVTVGLLGLIPMIGATLGAVLVCIVAFFAEPNKALIAGIYYLVYQQIENYLVAPRIMQRTVSVPGPVTIVAALAGAALLGVLGALLAIPVAAGLLLLYDEVLVPRQNRA
jgi:predicted PurR-regulated permease PerM